MNALDRSVLILGDEPSLVEPYVPLLRRAKLAVSVLLQPSGPIRLAEEAPRDLIIVVAPIANAARLFARSRAVGSPWRHTGVLLVAERNGRPELDPALTRFANRRVSPTATPEEFLREVAELLDVAPRVAVHASVQLKLVSPEGEAKSMRVENLSSTGMFVASDEPFPVGTVFGFALALPTEHEPIRGQAGVVRKAIDASAGVRGVGVRFLTLGGDGSERLDRLVRLHQERKNGAGTATASMRRVGASSGSIPRPAAPDLAVLKAELADLHAHLDELLRQGLVGRLGSVDWYLTGMERGLDSLHVFAVVLEAVHGGRAAAFETQNRIADLSQVRQRLANFALPSQDLRARIRVLLELRAPLERLRLELAGATGTPSLSSSRGPDAVAQVLAEIRRLVGARKGWASVRSHLLDLGSARHLFAPGAQRRIAERICQEYRPQIEALGFATPASLTSRVGRKDALLAVDRELRVLDQRLATIHEKIYARKFQHMASKNIESDLLEPKTLSILIDTLTPGREYLDRAYSAYRHALESAGADPALLDRAAEIAFTIRSAEREASGAFRTGPSAGVVRGA